MSKKLEKKTLLVKQIGSPIRRDKIQKEYLKSLGLNKMHKSRILQNTSEVLGLLYKVRHMVEVVEQ